MLGCVVMAPTIASKPAPTVYLIAVDETPSAAHALEVASALATTLGGSAELHVVHVVDVTPPVSMLSVALPMEPTELLQAGRLVLDQACSEAGGRFTGRIVGHLAAGIPWREIVQAASTLDADLVIVGTAGRTGFERVALGSVAEKVVRHAGCPVLVVRPNTYHAQGAITRPGAPLTPASV